MTRNDMHASDAKAADPMSTVKVECVHLPADKKRVLAALASNPLKAATGWYELLADADKISRARNAKNAG